MHQLTRVFCVTAVIVAVTLAVDTIGTKPAGTLSQVSVAKESSIQWIASRYPLRARTPSIFERSKGKSTSGSAVRRV